MKQKKYLILIEGKVSPNKGFFQNIEVLSNSLEEAKKIVLNYKNEQGFDVSIEEVKRVFYFPFFRKKKYDLPYIINESGKSFFDYD